MTTIELSENGIMIYGSIGIDDLDGIMQIAKNHNFDQMDNGVAQAKNACMVITNKAGSEKLREQVRRELSGLSIEQQWIRGCDTGISSKTIFSVMTGNAIDRTDIPYDCSDFGRCYRLVEMFPEWKSRLNEVSNIYPKWEPIIKNWDYLSSLYNDGNKIALSKWMQENTKG